MAKDTGVEAVREGAHALTGAPQEYDPLMRLIGDARVVLLGEASHGTHEFYQERARITARLIEEKGFTAVAVEADWPDALRVDRYVRGRSEDEFATEALADFKRFPTWMWRNTDVAEFLDWMRERNDALPEGASKAGFYGLDLYSLRASMESVLRYLEQVDPAAARQARERYACFDHFGEDTQVYGFATSMGLSKSCEEEVVHQLVELQRHAIERARRGGREEEEAFYAEQNARVVMNAEAYYRSMFVQEVSSWNLRDRHMAETIEQLVAYLERRGERAKIVVWAHNSHVGDARAAERAQRGELNVGQLVRERYGRDAVLIGFTTHHGTVTAASDWDAPASCSRSVSARTTRRRACARPSSNGRSASSTGPRPSERATTSMRACLSSSTRSSTSTRHARSSRSSARPNGSRARCRRRTPSRCRGDHGTRNRRAPHQDTHPNGSAHEADDDDRRGCDRIAVAVEGSRPPLVVDEIDLRHAVKPILLGMRPRPTHGQ
jgi:erythromycin esterase-like protein